MHPILRNLINTVDEEHREDLTRFLETGEYTPEFEAIIDGDERIQNIIEVAANIDSDNFFEALNKSLE